MLSIQDFTPDETRHLHALGYNRGPRHNDLVEAWNYILEADKFDRRARDFERNECTRSAAAPARATAEEYNRRAIAALEHYRSHKGEQAMSATTATQTQIANPQQGNRLGSPITASPTGQPSAALEEVRALRREVASMQSMTAEALRDMGAKLSALTAEVAALKNAAAAQPEAAPQAAPVTAPTGAHVCKIHDVQMTRKEKNGQAWWSHKNEEADAWCRGK
jgi:hypothetical protein